VDVLITGGAGFLGANLADQLLSLGHAVTVFDNLSAAGSAEAVRRLDKAHGASGLLTFVFRDVRDPAEVERAVVDRDAIFHAAGFASEEFSLLSPREDFTTRVSGSFNFLEAMRRFNPQAHLVLASSAAVYGLPPVLHGCMTFAADEKRAVRPETPFASGLACAEKYAGVYGKQYGLKLTVLRLASVYTSEPALEPEDSIVRRVVAAARGGAPLAPPVDPRWPIDLVHVDDVSRAVLFALAKREAAQGEVFNVGGGARSAPSVREMTQFLSMIGGKVALVPHLGEGRPSFVLDNSRLKNALGWQPSVTWQEGLTRMFSAWTGSPAEQQDNTNHGGLIAWPRVEGQA
jgi:CDP-paratose 2-epimerase